MVETECDLRDSLVHGWGAMAVLLVWMFVASIMEGVINRNFEPLANHVTGSNIWMMTIYICINVLMQMSIKQVDSKRFRWFTFGVAVIYALTFFVHHLTHVIGGDRFNLQTPLNLSHHIVGAWTAMTAFKWAKGASTQTVPVASPSLDTEDRPARDTLDSAQTIP